MYICRNITLLLYRLTVLREHPTVNYLYNYPHLFFQFRHDSHGAKQLLLFCYKKFTKFISSSSQKKKNTGVNTDSSPDETRRINFPHRQDKGMSVLNLLVYLVVVRNSCEKRAFLVEIGKYISSVRRKELVLDTREGLERISSQLVT